MRATLLTLWGLSFATLATLTAFRVASPLLVVLISSAWAIPLLAWSAHWLGSRGEERRSALLRFALVPLGLLMLAAGLLRAGIARPADIVLWWLTILSAIVPLAIALLALTTIAIAPEESGGGSREA